MPRIDLHADVKGLERLGALGRAYEGIGLSARKIFDATVRWARETRQPSEEILKRQNELNLRLKTNQSAIGTLTQQYEEWALKAQKPGPANEIERAKRMAEGFNTALSQRQRQQVILENQRERELADLRRQQDLQRGLRIGIAAVGIPAVIAGVRRVTSEYMAQEEILSGLAVRFADVNMEGGSFLRFTENLRKNIIDTGVRFAFTGREALQLVDAFTRLSGAMPDEGEIMRTARAYGVPLQSVGQTMAVAARFGGRAFIDDRRLADTISGVIEKTGMAPRAEEIMQSLTSQIQFYAQRLPEVDPRTIASIIGTINQSGIPAVRGTGVIQVMQGTQRMLDDMSEAMLAVRTQVVSRDPAMMRRAAQIAGIPAGQISPFVAERILSERGLADPSGIKLARDTLNYIVGGMNQGEKLVAESMILRLPINIVAALEKSGTIKRFLETNELTYEQFQAAAKREERAQMAQQNIFLQYRQFGSAAAGAFTSTAGALLRPTGPGIRGLTAFAQEMPFSFTAASILGTMGAGKLLARAGIGGIARASALLGEAGLVGAAGLGGFEFGSWMQGRKMQDQLEDMSQIADFMGKSGRAFVSMAGTTPGGAAIGQGARLAMDVTLRVIGEGEEIGEAAGRRVLRIIRDGSQKLIDEWTRMMDPYLNGGASPMAANPSLAGPTNR